jgi:lambda family phage portal protein
MNFLDRILGQIAPGVAVTRAKNRMALQVITARYEAATSGNRAAPGRVIRTDADAASAKRDNLAFIGRDLVRNSPFAGRIPQVVANNVIADGIIPKVRSKQKRLRAALFAAIEAHLDTTAIDADGRNNLYGLQRLAMNTIVESGEVLIRRRRRLATDGLPLPFQIQVLEADYICTAHDVTLDSGNVVKYGIEYDPIGRRVAYWLYRDHPGTTGQWLRSSAPDLRRVPASELLHIYRVDRPGQSRGVSWFAPVAMMLQDFADYVDAQIMRQKIAAVFAAFRTSPEADPLTPPGGDAAATPERFSTLSPGRIENLLPGESMVFGNPPGVEGLDETTRMIMRGVASGVGITYEALTGDLSNVNFSSGRMGRMEMDRNVSSWQWLMMIPQMMQPIGAWVLEAYQVQNGVELPEDVKLDWVPPHRVLVDPTREIPALIDQIRGGLASWSGTVRELGKDPERLIEEISEDAANVDARQLIFDSDARKTSSAGQAQLSASKTDNQPQGGQNAAQQ